MPCGMSSAATITPVPFTPWEKAHNPIAPFNAVSPLKGDEGGGADFSYGLVDARTLTFILNLMETDASTKFLAKPRILVQDRESAEIKVTADQIVSLKTTVNNQGASTVIQTEVERMEVGTILRLIPVINEQEGFVSMLLEPSVSRPILSAFTDPAGVNTFIDPQKRSLRTVVMVRDGETVAVGGFITTEDEEKKTKIPWLGDIPVVGAAFRHQKTQKVDKELLIFITPKIVRAVRTVDMTIPSAGASAETGAPQPAASAASVKPSGAAPDESSKKITAAFREQEDVKLDLTLQSANSGVINLAR
ncbi:MAG: type II and III secretion system protein [Candidatus Omnitrophica bacterium]|nr:type II and III secretion system protein [Candidatus Omnitrophota bacterium]